MSDQEFNPMATPGAFQAEPLAPVVDTEALEQPPVEPLVPPVEQPPEAPAQEQPPVVEPVVAEQPPAISGADSVREYVIPGLQDQPLANTALTEEALAVKEKLANEPKMPMFIPLDPGEKPGAYRSVTINTYRCEIKKGMMINLPMSIATLLMSSYQIEAETLNNNEFNLQNADARTQAALA